MSKLPTVTSRVTDDPLFYQRAHRLRGRTITAIVLDDVIGEEQLRAATEAYANGQVIAVNSMLGMDFAALELRIFTREELELPRVTKPHEKFSDDRPYGKRYHRQLNGGNR